MGNKHCLLLFQKVHLCWKALDVMAFLKIYLMALISTVVAVETHWANFDPKLVTAKEINNCIRVFQHVRERKVKEIEQMIHEVPASNFCKLRKDGVYADPFKCEGMIKCINRHTYTLNCRKPMLYNPWTHKCDLPKNVDCMGRFPWTKLGETCYGTKDNSFGTVVLPRAGTVVALKLTHTSGKLYCKASWFGKRIGSLWACEDDIATVVTNSRDHVLLPKRGKVQPSSKWFYKLPNHTPNSPYLIFTDYSRSIVLAKNEKLRVWYGEDLIKSFFTMDNGGKHCISVEAKIVERV